ncbi:MAG TPA: response regulator [Kofleriaceae bacterium]|nr:response regulator [Kofleriaceae bacterium]
MKRVLLLDDHADEARELASQLRSRGWHVTIVSSARAAFDAIPELQPDAIITELALPDAQGLHVVRALRSLVERDIVVVALTRDADALGERAIAAGFDHVARKPAHVDALHARMEDLAA